jgi:hypothetical protein
MAELKHDWVQLQTDVQAFRDQLAEAAETVVDEGVSNYPIFFAFNGSANEQVPGIFVTEIATNRGTNWQLNITTLEELVAKTVIPPEKVDPFREVYKKNSDSLCFLIVDDEGARFGFVGKG